MKPGRDVFRKFKPAINILIIFYSILPRKIRLMLFEFHRPTKGKKGILIRYVLLKTLAKNVGDNVSVHPNVYIFNMNELYIGDNVSIHPMCYIEAKGGIKIGNNVSIAHSVTLLSVNHIHSDVNRPIKYQGIDFKETEIKSDVWVGAKASILAGVTVESGTVVATGAVVNKDVEKNSIVGGVPAKLIKYRGR